jgi:hypothetical protein
MSITFWVPSAEDSHAPELNVANGNFQHLGEALGLNPAAIEDGCGQIAAGDLYDKVRKLQRGLEEQHQEFERSEVVNTPDDTGGCTEILCGCTAQQLERYCGILLQVVVTAYRYESDITFS